MCIWKTLVGMLCERGKLLSVFFSFPDLETSTWVATVAPSSTILQ